MANSQDDRDSRAQCVDDLEVVLSPETSELRTLAVKIEEFAATHDLSEKAVGTISLVLEEAVTNVMMYAFEGMPETSRKLSVRLRRTPGFFSATIVDNGAPFDPTTGEPEENTADGDHDEVGGWGIKLIRNLMDEVRYRRAGDLNQLELVLKT